MGSIEQSQRLVVIHHYRLPGRFLQPLRPPRSGVLLPSSAFSAVASRATNCKQVPGTAAAGAQCDRQSWIAIFAAFRAGKYEAVAASSKIRPSQ